MDKVTIKRSGNFTQIDNEIVNNPDITWKSKGLMLYFLSKPDNWKVNVRGDVHKRGKEGRDSVYKGITELVEHGYISRTKDQDGFVHYHIFEDRYKNDKNDYLLNNNPNPENQDKQKSPQPENQDPEIQEPENQSVLVRHDSSNTECNNTIAHSSKYSDEFERWWSIYPRKQGKGKAYTNWKRDKLDSRVDELIEKLQQQVAMEYAFTEIGYIPHGSTYLNESRYDDDVIPKRVNNERSGNNNPKGESFKEFATELSNRVDKNRHIYDELPDDYVF